MPRSQAKLTENQRAKAIEAYTISGNMSKAGKAIGVCRQTLSEEKKRNKAFKEAMENAKETYVDSLVEIAWARAESGESKMADTLLMFLIKAGRPEYRDKQEITAKVDGNIKIISGIPRPKEEPAKE